jgi:branched-chain amino acid aminotransferase
MKIYIDGKFYDRGEAKISVFDHGMLYGDGVFEGLRIYHGKVFRLKEHIDRLFRSAQTIWLAIPHSREEMAQLVNKAVKENKKQDGYIRLVVTRGEGCLGIDPANCSKPSVIIIVGDIQLYPAELYEKGISVVTASTRRTPADCLEPRVKSLNYLNNILAKIEANQAGALESVMLNHQGYVVECSADNILIVKNGALLTPAPHHGALDGITMRTVMDAARSIGMEVREADLTRYDLYSADECFMTGTGAEIMPVTMIDGRKVGTGVAGVITKKLLAEFRKLAAE